MLSPHQTDHLVQHPRRIALSACLALLVAWTASLAAAPSVTITPDSQVVNITRWLVAGPLPSPPLAEPEPDGPARAGFDTDFLTAIGGETGARIDAGTAVSPEDGSRFVFTEHAWDTPYLDLTRIYGRPAAVCAYLYSEIRTRRAMDVYLHVGTNDAGKVWVGRSTGHLPSGRQRSRAIPERRTRSLWPPAERRFC